VAKTQSRVLAQKEPCTPRTVTRSLHLCTTQVAQDEEVKRIEISDASQDVLLMQPAVMVGLIFIMTGSALQEDIAFTVQVLVRKGRDILDMNPGSVTTRPTDENQTTAGRHTHCRRISRHFALRTSLSDLTGFVRLKLYL
jgi:hypothetical protein